MRLVSLNLPVDLIAAISRAARDAGQTPQDLLRATLAHVFAAAAEGKGAAWAALPPREPPPPEAPGPATAGADGLPGGSPPFTVHLAFAEALGWLDLQSRLRAAGFVLRLGKDGVLALHSWPADHRLIDSAALGQPLETLTLRFRAAFPGQVLAGPAGAGAEQPETGARAERRFPAPPARKGRAA